MKANEQGMVDTKHEVRLILNKVERIVVSLFLASILISLSLASTSPDVSSLQKDGFRILSPDLILTRADYDMSIAVADTSRLGRYTEATASGKKLLYGYPSAGTSYATIRIDGNDYYQNSAMDLYCTQTPVTVNDSIITKWALPGNINATEKLTLMPNTTEYRFTIINNDNTTHNFDFRYLFDTMLAYNDGASVFG